MDVDFGGYNIGMERGGVVVLKEHDPRWAACFHRVAEQIRAVLEPYNMDLHHIGSTSIPGIKAKPILDVLGVVEDMEGFEKHAQNSSTLASSGKANTEFWAEDTACCTTPRKP